MAVRLDRELRATIDKVVASYNRKITRYKKMGYKTPEKIKYIDVASLPSRKSIGRVLNSLSSFNIKSVDPVVYKNKLITVYEKEGIENQINKSKRVLRRRIKKLMNTEYKMYGNKAGYTMGDRAMFLNLYNDLDNGRIKSDKLISNLRKLQRLENTTLEDFLNMSGNKRESFNNLLIRIENPYINKKLKDNYLEALTDLGYSYGYDKDKLADIEKKLKMLSNEEFEKLFTEDLGIRKLLSYYDIMKINLGRNNISENQEAVFSTYNSIYENLDIILGNYNK